MPKEVSLYKGSNRTEFDKTYSRYLVMHFMGYLRRTRYKLETIKPPTIKTGRSSDPTCALDYVTWSFTTMDG